MAGRSRAAAHPPPPSAGLFGRPPPQSGLFGPPPPHHLDPRRPLDPRAAIAALEDRLAAQGREIQELLIDNQRLAATHVALKQELTAADRDLHLVATDSARARDDREAEVRAVYERAAKAEAEARLVEAVREELERVRSDLVKLRAVRDEIEERVRGVKMEAERAKAEVAQAPELRAEIEAMHREIQRGRAAVEYEKNAHAGNMEQSQAMEANMVTLAREVEKLRAELANAEKRAATATVAANPGYTTGMEAMEILRWHMEHIVCSRPSMTQEVLMVPPSMDQEVLKVFRSMVQELLMVLHTMGPMLFLVVLMRCNKLMGTDKRQP